MATLTPESRRVLIQLLRQKLSPNDARDIANDWGYTIGLGAGIYDGLVEGGTYERIAALVDRAQQVEKAVELLANIEHWRPDLREILAPLRPNPIIAEAEPKQPTKVSRLQEYKDKILDLKHNEGLDDVPKKHPLRNTARELTEAVLPLLPRKDKGELLLFLYKEGLITAKYPIIDLNRVNLREADLREDGSSQINLRGVDLHGAYMHEANLCGADLREANLSTTNLHGANLHSANLRGADLYRVDFGDAVLVEADLSETDLTVADLSRADLNQADLSGANLQITTISNEQIKSARAYAGIKNRIVT